MSSPDPFETLRGILGEMREERGGASLFEEQLSAARRGTTVGAREARRRKIATLVEQGATEGERSAARAALQRFDNPVSHDEMNRMQRGGNFAGDE